MRPPVSIQGRYTLDREIGRGGMGAVYFARTAEGRAVAVKVLLARGRPESVARFERERRLLASLGESDGFVPLLDSGVERDLPFLVMPFVEGGTLRQRLDRGPLGVDETRALGVALATALGRAHARGIVHRDVKPENVLHTKDGRPLLSDLGLAKHFRLDVSGASQSQALSRGGDLRGTLAYMAPEQSVDSASVGPPADVFALASTLFECLAGVPAFEAESAVELLTKAAKGEHGSLALLRPETPPRLRAAIERALSPDPRARFADGRAFALALDEPADEPGGPSRGRLALLLVGGLAVLGVGVGLGLGLRGTAPLAARSPAPAASPLRPTPAPAPSPAWPTGVPRAPGLRLGPKVRHPSGGEIATYLVSLPAGGDLELVWVPPGEYVLGTDDPNAGPDDRPRRRETVARGFWIGRTPVTWARWLAYCTRTGRPEPAKSPWWDRADPAARLEHPVVNVSWEEAREFCAWASLALPTVVEWEAAARGPDGREYPWGDDEPTPDLAVFGRERNSPVETEPAGSRPLGASPSGALDMCGNVWQWCEDGFPPASGVGDGETRVIRGGCWMGPGFFGRGSHRDTSARTHHSRFFGFRVVLRP